MTEPNKFYIKVDDTEDCDEDNENNFSKKLLLFLRTLLRLLIAFLLSRFPRAVFFGLPILSNVFNTQSNFNQ